MKKRLTGLILALFIIFSFSIGIAANDCEAGDGQPACPPGGRSFNCGTSNPTEDCEI